MAAVPMYIIVSFGLPHAFPLLQRPIHRSCLLLLDFYMPSLRFNVQSTTLFHSFWTSSVYFSASTSNPPLFPAPFGLPPCIPLLQRPFHLSFPLFLDFRMPPLRFNIQSQPATPHNFFHYKYFNC